MKTGFWLDRISLGGVFVLTFLVVLTGVGIGTLAGRQKSREGVTKPESSLGTIIGAMLGLVAFLLAFTFGIAAERLQAQKQFLLQEVNSIGTTFLRAEMLPQPHGRDVRQLLREYVEIRVSLAQERAPVGAERARAAVTQAEDLQEKMWSHAVAVANAEDNPVIDALFIESLNETIDLQNSRLTVLGYRVPNMVWNVLYVGIILSSLLVGYQAGSAGADSLKVGVVLALTFAMVMLLIADLDRPTEGRLQVSQQPMFDLQKQIQKTGEADGP